MSARSKLAGLGRRLTQFLLVEEFRTAVTVIRYVYYRVLLRRLEVFAPESSDISEHALRHNLDALRRSVVKSARTHVLIRPLTVIQRIRPRIVEASVLSIGPRAEGELLNLLAHGFRWKNITGLDLFSYSPKIDVGDIHAMPYEDDRFDVVIASRVLGYSEAPRRAAAEMIRVTRSGGVIAVNTGDVQDGPPKRLKKGYRAGSADRMATLQELLDVFGDCVDQVYHCNDPSNEAAENRGSIVAIFSITKQGRRDDAARR